jgi:hypothetical protein
MSSSKVEPTGLHFHSSMYTTGLAAYVHKPCGDDDHSFSPLNALRTSLQERTRGAGSYACSKLTQQRVMCIET